MSDADPGPRPAPPRRAVRAATGGPADLADLAGQTSDDTDVGWGEVPDADGPDRWLREQRPPHWE